METVWQSLYQQCCIFPIIDSPRYLPQALESPEVGVVILGEALHLLNAQRIIAQIHQAGKLAFVDMDLVGGLSTDQYAIGFLTKEACADGLISKQRTVLAQAKKQGLFTIYKVFVTDMHAIEIAASTIEAVTPDALDLLPGVAAPFVQPLLRNCTDIPFSVSGFYDPSPSAIAKLLQSGISAVHTRERSLWGQTRQSLLTAP